MKGQGDHYDLVAIVGGLPKDVENRSCGKVLRIAQGEISQTWLECGKLG